MPNKYQVDFHLIHVVYFEPGQVFSGEEFGRVWSGMRMFGKHQVHGGFWRMEDRIDGKEKKCELGSLEFIEPLLAKNNRPICGGGTFVRRDFSRHAALDCDFYF